MADLLVRCERVTCGHDLGARASACNYPRPPVGNGALLVLGSKWWQIRIWLASAKGSRFTWSQVLDSSEQSWENVSRCFFRLVPQILDVLAEEPTKMSLKLTVADPLPSKYYKIIQMPAFE